MSVYFPPTMSDSLTLNMICYSPGVAMSLGLLTSTLRAAQRLKDVNYSNVFSLESFLKPSDDQVSEMINER